MTPAAANIAVLVITVWVEKMTTFSFVYAVVLIGKFLTADKFA
jgi:hypothetical protein